VTREQYKKYQRLETLKKDLLAIKPEKFIIHLPQFSEDYGYDIVLRLEEWLRNEVETIERMQEQI